MDGVTRGKSEALGCGLGRGHGNTGRRRVCWAVRPSMINTGFFLRVRSILCSGALPLSHFLDADYDYLGAPWDPRQAWCASILDALSKHIRRATTRWTQAVSQRCLFNVFCLPSIPLQCLADPYCLLTLRRVELYVSCGECSRYACAGARSCARLRVVAATPASLWSTLRGWVSRPRMRDPVAFKRFAVVGTPDLQRPFEAAAEKYATLVMNKAYEVAAFVVHFLAMN
eukprot:3341279-Pleurochrysis_carterae.AAC.2